MSYLFKCAYCDHTGSDGCMHMKNFHPTEYQSWLATMREEHKKKLEQEEKEKEDE